MRPQRPERSLWQVNVTARLLGLEFEELKPATLHALKRPANAQYAPIEVNV